MVTPPRRPPRRPLDVTLLVSGTADPTTCHIQGCPPSGLSEGPGSMADMDDAAPLSRTDAQGAVADLGWRLLLGELVTVVPLDSLAEGAGLLATVTVELGPDGDAHPRADLRPDR